MRLLLFTSLVVIAAQAINITIPIVPINIPLPDLKDLNPLKIAEMFGQFVTGFGKKYSCKEQRESALKKFGENVKEIIKLNTDFKSQGVQFGINMFSDLTNDEFKQQVLMDKADKLDIPVRNQSFLNLQRTKFGSAPASYDWRTNKNMVGPVKSQGSCGCCWAFATAAVVTSAYGMRNKKLVEASEQQICDCAGPSNRPGCQGGWTENGLDYAMRKGVSPATSYTAYTPARSSKTGVCAASGKPNNMRIKEYGRIDPSDAETLKGSLYFFGPMGVAMSVSSVFRHYKSGIFSNTDCNYDSKIIGWHAVAAVGYCVEKGVNYWIVKNSWGTGFGEAGYFRIKRGSDLCYIESTDSMYAYA